MQTTQPSIPDIDPLKLRPASIANCDPKLCPTMYPLEGKNPKVWNRFSLVSRILEMRSNLLIKAVYSSIFIS